MMMSVFRAGRPRSQLDHLGCMQLAMTDRDLEMFTWSFMHAKPALVGLDGVEAIIKPEEAGDEAMSFEKLYDTCVSLRDFESMKRHQVDDPAELKPLLYQADLLLEVDFHPRVRVRLRAKNDLTARRRLNELLRVGEAFYQQFMEHMTNQIFSSDDVNLATSGLLTIEDPAPDDCPEWAFVNPLTNEPQ